MPKEQRKGTPAPRTQGAGHNEVIDFTPSPHVPDGRPWQAPVRLPPRIIHGCVDWFDYSCHPLHEGEYAADCRPAHGR